MPDEISTKNIVSAHILISRICVNNCVFCATALKRKQRRFLTPPSIRDFIVKSAEKGIKNIIFSGLGEPTLDPNFIDYLRCAQGQSFSSITLFTNGYQLTNERARCWKDLGLTNVLLSIHGMQNGHDQSVQRQNAFNDSVAALDICCQFFSVSVNTCLTRYNIDEITDLVDFLASYPLIVHSLSFPEWTGNVEKYEDAMIGYEQVVDLADSLPERLDGNVHFDNVPLCLVRQKTIESRGIVPIQYFDGQTETVFHPQEHKIFPEYCTRKPCPLLNKCPGFEEKYIQKRGWPKIPKRTSSLQSQKKQKNTEHMTVIIKPTNRCNGNCRYCANDKKDCGVDMDATMIDSIYDDIARYAETGALKILTMLWHGGEPLLMHRSFYIAAWDKFLTMKNVTIQNLLQSNLLLLDNDWIDLFNHYHINISTSVDPFDGARIYKNGKRQYTDWLENFLLMCDSGTRVGIVFTATARHRDCVDAVYAFFKNLQTFASKPIGIRINPVIASGNGATETAKDLMISPLDYGEFLCALWRLWDGDGRLFPLAPFDEWLRPDHRSCEISGACQENFLAINHSGNASLCGRFSDSSMFLGNIRTDKFSDIVQHPFRKKLSERKKNLLQGQCRDCAYWHLCNGGCPYYAYLYYNDINHPTYFCQSYRHFFDSTPVFSQIEDKV